MRSLLLNLAVSLDGYIEDASGAYDWCFTDQDYGMTEFLSRVDALLLGRTSFEVMQRELSGLFRDKTWYVFSNTLTDVPEGMHLISGDWETQLRELKKQPGGDLWLFGGAVLTAHLMQADLVDELILSIHPVLLGGGTPLYPSLTQRTWLELREAKPYSSGLVQLHYRLKPTTP